MRLPSAYVFVSMYGAMFMNFGLHVTLIVYNRQTLLTFSSVLQFTFKFARHFCKIKMCVPKLI